MIRSWERDGLGTRQVGKLLCRQIDGVNINVDGYPSAAWNKAEVETNVQFFQKCPSSNMWMPPGGCVRHRPRACCHPQPMCKSIIPSFQMWFYPFWAEKSTWFSDKFFLGLSSVGLWKELHPSFPPWPQMTLPDVQNGNLHLHYI